MILNFKKYFFTISILVLFSCSKQNDLIENSYKNSLKNHSIKEVLIRIDSLSYSFEYYISFDYIIRGKEVFFIGYNYKSHSLDYFNLTKSHVTGHLKLEKQGPNGINEVNGINIISSDSILIADNQKFCIINNKGTLIWKIMKNDPRIFKNIPNAYLNTKRASFKPGFNYIKNSLILYYRPIEDKYLFKMPIIIEIGIDTFETNFFPIFYPNYIKNNRENNPIYGGPRACFTKQCMIFNYSFESNIYVFDLEKKKLFSYGGKSKYTQNQMKPIKKNTNPYDYGLTSLCFFKVVYDPYKYLYYRTHWGEMALKKSEFEYNTYYDKPVFLTVFDNNFNYLYETKLEIPSGIIPEHLVPTPDGLMVFPYKQIAENLENNFMIGILINFN